MDLKFKYLIIILHIVSFLINLLKIRGENYFWPVYNSTLYIIHIYIQIDNMIILSSTLQIIDLLIRQSNMLQTKHY